MKSGIEFRKDLRRNIEREMLKMDFDFHTFGLHKSIIVKKKIDIKSKMELKFNCHINQLMDVVRINQYEFFGVIYWIYH